MLKHASAKTHKIAAEWTFSDSKQLNWRQDALLDTTCHSGLTQCVTPVLHWGCKGQEGSNVQSEERPDWPCHTSASPLRQPLLHPSSARAKRSFTRQASAALLLKSNCFGLHNLVQLSVDFSKQSLGPTKPTGKCHENPNDHEMTE